MSSVAAPSLIEIRPYLSERQVADFHAQGYLAIERIISDEEVASIRATLERLFAARTGRESGDQFDLAGSDDEGKPAGLPQILGPSRFAPELAETTYRAHGLAIGRQLLTSATVDAAQVRFGGDHTILKPARYGKGTPWHQDEAYWDPWHDHNSISIWLALQKTTIHTGCMWFVPGSHRGEILPHRPINDDPRVHGLELVDGNITNGVAVELPAGGAVIHKERTLHYAAPNTSDIQRYAYIIGFSTPARKRAVRREVPWQDRQRTPRSDRARAAAEAKAAAEAQALDAARAASAAAAAPATK